jgi:ATP-dependent DNA helicase 2 subunit 1
MFNMTLIILLFGILSQKEEKLEEGGWIEPAGFHLITLPFADDIRAAPEQVMVGARGELATCGASASLLSHIHRPHSIASDELKDKAFMWLKKLQSKNGYPSDSYPNPGKSPQYTHDAVAREMKLVAIRPGIS